MRRIAEDSRHRRPQMQSKQLQNGARSLPQDGVRNRVDAQRYDDESEESPGDAQFAVQIGAV
jgi:hypothetical protein